MADKVIGELPSISSLDAGSLFVAEQSGQAVKVTGKQLTDFSNVETTAQVEQAKASAQAAKTAQAAAESAILKGPIIQNGTWWVYNQTAGAYQDTGINTTGPQGIPGPTASVNSIPPDGSGNITLTAGDVNAYSKTETNTLLQNKVNPNLLDNWYFGNPVNQRNGYVVPAGKTYYSDAACTAVAGTTTKAYTVYPLNSTTFWGYKESDHSVKFYEKAEDVIRGYVGGMYGLDRWRVSANGIITVTDTGVLLQKATNSTYGSTYEMTDAAPLLGKEITIAALINDNLYVASGTVPNAIPTQNTTVCISALVNNIAVQAYLYTTGVLTCEVVNRSADSCKVVAAKLELGTTQTLAHQDESGNWALNEIPNYDEQLRRCQRYFMRIGVPNARENGAIGFANCAITTLANTCINTPVTMRAIPSATLKNIVLRKGITDFNVTGCNIFAITGNGIYMNFVSSGLTVGDTLLIRTATGGYIDFTADL